MNDDQREAKLLDLAVEGLLPSEEPTEQLHKPGDVQSAPPAGAFGRGSV